MSVLVFSEMCETSSSPVPILIMQTAKSAPSDRIWTWTCDLGQLGIPQCISSRPATAAVLSTELVGITSVRGRPDSISMKQKTANPNVDAKEDFHLSIIGARASFSTPLLCNISYLHCTWGLQHACFVFLLLHLTSLQDSRTYLCTRLCHSNEFV